jgi:hypothetical protein
MSYSPASIVTSGALPNLVAIHYEREAVPNLKAQTPFLSMTKQRPLPLRQGNQIQFYTYALLAANLNQAAEGTVNNSFRITNLRSSNLPKSVNICLAA